MRESSLQKSIIDDIKNRGGMALKIEKANDDCYPDLLIKTSSMKAAAMIEVKKDEVARRSEKQKYIIGFLNRIGFPAYFVDSWIYWCQVKKELNII